MSLRGRVNVYRCDECRGEMVTLDLEDGDVPFLTSCQLPVDAWLNETTRVRGVCCEGRAASTLYPDDAQNRHARFGWRHPRPGERLGRVGASHARAGLMVLRPL